MGRPKKPTAAIAEPQQDKQDQILSLLQGLVKRVDDLEQSRKVDEEQDEQEEIAAPKKKAGRPKKVVADEKPKRPNLFEKMKEFNDHKNDTAIDKLLWKDRKPAERSRVMESVSVVCTQCHKEFKLSPNEPIGEFYKCNRCICGGRR